LIVTIAAYAGLQIWMWIKARKLRSVPFVRPAEAARAISSDGGVIFDVRSHGYYDRNATRIQGSRRLEPNALPQFTGDIPAETQVYLYCTCLREATSVRVANILRDQGFHVSVIKGGLRAWTKAGLPVEAVPAEEMAAMPTFD
jgi:rhodanese-related sulfurtransferase